MGPILALTPLVLTLRVLIFNTIVIALCIQLGISSEYNEPGRYFREGRLMTWISTLQLIAIGYLCGLIWNKLKSTKKFYFKDSAAIWKIMSYGFYFLAFDEILKVHEAIDRYAHKIFGFVITETSDHLDDLIIVIYAMIGIIILFSYRKQIMSFISCYKYLLLALVASLLTIVLDFLSGSTAILKYLISNQQNIGHYMTWLSVFEEVFKIYAEVFFIGAVFYCYKKALTSELV